MSIICDKYKVLFLIDMDFWKSPEAENPSPLECSKLVNLCVLRTLTHLSCLSGKVQSSVDNHKLQWGFKFYNSPKARSAKLVSDTKNRHRFQDFTLKNIEKFAKDVELQLVTKCEEGRKLEECGAAVGGGSHTRYLRNQQENTNVLTGGWKRNTESIPYQDRITESLKSLQDSVRELLYEFQWDAPDISSPVKPTRRASLPQQRRSTRQYKPSTGDADLTQKDVNCKQYDQRNFVFLLSQAPQTIGELVGVVANGKPDPKCLLETFMPMSLGREFHHIRRINMYWLDTRIRYTCQLQSECEAHCLQLIGQMMQLLGGCLIPAQSLVVVQPHQATAILSTQQHKTTVSSLEDHIQQEAVDNLVVSAIAMPTSSVLDYYLLGAASGGLSQTHPRLIPPWTSTLNHTQDRLTQAPCRMELVPLVTGGNRSEFGDPEGKLVLELCGASDGSQVSEQSLLGRRTDVLGVTVQADTGPSQHAARQHYATGTLARNSDSGTPRLAQIKLKALGLQANQPIGGFQNVTSFVVRVSAADLREQHRATEFEALLRLLARHRLNMVVEVDVDGSQGPGWRLGLLQPLTSASAALTFNWKPSVMASIPSHKGAPLGPSCSGQQMGQIETEVDRAVSHHCNTVLESRDCDATAEADDEADFGQRVQTCQFRAALLEKWMLPEAVAQSAEKCVLPEAQSGELLYARLAEEILGDSLEKHEVQVLCKLQSMYRKSKCRRLNGLTGSTSTSGITKKVSTTPRTPRRGSRTPRKKCVSGRLSGSSAGGRTASARSRSPRKRLSRKTPRKTPRKSPRKRLVGAKQLARAHGRHQMAPTRVELILRRSKEQQCRESVDEAAADTADRASALPPPSLPDHGFATVDVPALHSEQELKQHCQQLYQLAIDGLSTAHPTACLIHHTVRKFDTQKELQPLLVDLGVLLSSESIKGKYNTGQAPDVAQKLREYELQVFLRVEAVVASVTDPSISSSSRQDAEEEDAEVPPHVQEIAMLLRGMSFMEGPAFLPSFIRESLLQRYVEKVPRLLVQVYEELLQPVPQELEGFLSDVSGEDGMMDSVVGPDAASMQSIGPYGEAMGPPSASTRAKKLKRYSSFHAVSQRQIQVPSNPNNKKKNHHRRRSNRIASLKKPKIHTKEKDCDKASEAVNVRRNLFCEGLAPPAVPPGGPSTALSSRSLQRRQSVAVMQSAVLRRSPRKPVMQSAVLRRSPRKPVHKHHAASVKSPRAKGRLSCPGGGRNASVSETPACRQVQHTLLRRQETRRRRRADTQPNITVVHESPLKPGNTHSGAGVGRRGKSRVQLLRRSSFYSSAPESRNVSKLLKHELLEARMTKKLLSPAVNKPRSLAAGALSCTRRIKPVSLFSGLFHPSPQKARGASGSRLGGLDSPSKHTRSRSLTGPLMASCQPINPFSDHQAVDFDSPGRRTLVQSALFDSPGKRSRVQSALFDSPGKRSRVQSALFDSPGRRSRVQTSSSVSSSVFTSPTWDDSSFASPSKNTRSHAMSAQRAIFTSPPLAASQSPGKHTRSQTSSAGDGSVFPSPAAWDPRCDSPSKCVRSSMVTLLGSSMFASSSNPSSPVLPPTRGSSLGTPHKQQSPFARPACGGLLSPVHSHIARAGKPPAAAPPGIPSQALMDSSTCVLANTPRKVSCPSAWSELDTPSKHTRAQTGLLSPSNDCPCVTPIKGVSSAHRTPTCSPRTQLTNLPPRHRTPTRSPRNQLTNLPPRHQTPTRSPRTQLTNLPPRHQTPTRSPRTQLTNLLPRHRTPTRSPRTQLTRLPPVQTHQDIVPVALNPHGGAAASESSSVSAVKDETEDTELKCTLRRRLKGIARQTKRGLTSSMDSQHSLCSVTSMSPRSTPRGKRKLDQSLGFSDSPAEGATRSLFGTPRKRVRVDTLTSFGSSTVSMTTRSNSAQEDLDALCDQEFVRCGKLETPACDYPKSNGSFERKSSGLKTTSSYEERSQSPIFTSFPSNSLKENQNLSSSLLNADTDATQVDSPVFDSLPRAAPQISARKERNRGAFREPQSVAVSKGVSPGSKGGKLSGGVSCSPSVTVAVSEGVSPGSKGGKLSGGVSCSPSVSKGVSPGSKGSKLSGGMSYSPTVSQHSLVHLIHSPLLDPASKRSLSNKLQQSPLSYRSPLGQSSAGQGQGQSLERCPLRNISPSSDAAKRSGRRALYRTRTQTDITSSRQ